MSDAWSPRARTAATPASALGEPRGAAGAHGPGGASLAAAASQSWPTSSSAWAPQPSCPRSRPTRTRRATHGATELLRADATIADVRVLLGHASVKTTSIYLASGEDRQEHVVQLRERQRPTLDDDRDAA